MMMKKVLPLSLAGAMAVAMTACNLNNLPTKVAPTQEGTVENTLNPSIGKASGNAGTGSAGANGSVATNPNLAGRFAKPNATVQGRLLDTKGQPIADAIVLAANGQVVKTDARGEYVIRVTAETDKEVVLIFQKDGYVFSSERVTMKPGETAMVDANVKQLDKNVVAVSPEGGTFKNSTGVLEVDIPKGSLNGTGNMVMTPLSFGANGTDNELPGPLETVDEKGQRLLLMPAEYWSIDLSGTTLKEGETMTMRMKLPPNPLAPVQLKAGDMIPCYIYDAALGYWNSPNLGPVVEKDGALWATYEIKASALTNRADVARSVQHIIYGTREAPISDADLRHNEAHEAEGGNSFGSRTAGGGVIGGHTFFNLFGTRMQGLVKDEKGNPLSATVTIADTTRRDHITTTNGSYSSLQYRGQTATVTATVNRFCETTERRDTARSNMGPLPPNQFGFSPEGQMEQRDPVSADWAPLVVDTRHPIKLTLKGESAAGATYTLQAGNGAAVPVTFTNGQTTKILDRGVNYTLGVTATAGVGQTRFTVPATHEKGQPVDVTVEITGGAK